MCQLELAMIPHRRRYRSSVTLSWSSYCYCDKSIAISVLIVLTGAVVSYYSMNQDITHHIHTIQKQTTEIRSFLGVLNRTFRNMQNNPNKHKCKSILVEQVRGVVREGLEYQNGNKTDKPDYTLGSAAVTIINTIQTNDSAKALSLFGIPICRSKNSPNVLSQFEIMPGACWTSKGQAGTAVIRLNTKIYVTGVSVEYISRSISFRSKTNFPSKEFSIWGLQSLDDKERFFFGQYTYNTNGDIIQHFPISHKCLRMFDIIEFKVHSNYGHPEYISIYRLLVHGDLRRN